MIVPTGRQTDIFLLLFRVLWAYNSPTRYTHPRRIFHNVTNVGTNLLYKTYYRTSLNNSCITDKGLIHFHKPISTTSGRKNTQIGLEEYVFLSKDVFYGEIYLLQYIPHLYGRADRLVNYFKRTVTF